MDETLRHLTRMFLVLPILLLLSPVMGKRALSELHLFDFLWVAATAEAAAITIADTNVSLVPMLITIAALGASYWGFTLLTLKVEPLRHLIFRGPSVVIEKGKINRKKLYETHLNIDVLMGMLRNKNAFELADVEFAILEENGDLSVMKTPAQEPVTRSDLGIQSEAAELMIAVVIDGTIIPSALSYLGKDEAWLRERLQRRGIRSLEKAILVTANKTGQVYIAKELKRAH
ncbi:MAG: DUF421 domain-containing protein [Bacillota bacterium]